MGCAPSALESTVEILAQEQNKKQIFSSAIECNSETHNHARQVSPTTGVSTRHRRQQNGIPPMVIKKATKARHAPDDYEVVQCDDRYSSCYCNAIVVNKTRQNTSAISPKVNAKATQKQHRVVGGSRNMHQHTLKRSNFSLQPKGEDSMVSVHRKADGEVENEVGQAVLQTFRKMDAMNLSDKLLTARKSSLSQLEQSKRSSDTSCSFSSDEEPEAEKSRSHHNPSSRSKKKVRKSIFSRRQRRNTEQPTARSLVAGTRSSKEPRKLRGGSLDETLGRGRSSTKEDQVHEARQEIFRGQLNLMRRFYSWDEIPLDFFVDKLVSDSGESHKGRVRARLSAALSSHPRRPSSKVAGQGARARRSRAFSLAPPPAPATTRAWTNGKQKRQARIIRTDSDLPSV